MTRLITPLIVLATLGITPVRAEAPKQCDFPTQPGTYKSGDWEYTYQIVAFGTRSEKRIGVLREGGREVAVRPDETVETPLGRFKGFSGRYSEGWLNTLSYARPAFAEDKPRAEVLQGNFEFGVELYGRLRGRGGNLFFSPYSVSTCLAMAYAGARGTTAEEMSRVLHYAADQARFHPAMADVMRRINGNDLPHKYRLEVADALWAQAGKPPATGFVSVLDRNYGIALRSADFASNPELARGEINQWVERKTNDKIKDLLRPGQVTAATRLVLTNALYFKATWQSRFPKNATAEAEFRVSADRTVRVPMMHYKGMLGYLENDEFQALELPYERRQLSLIVLLPKKSDKLAAFEESMTAARLTSWLGRLKEKAVDVSLPRFRITSEFDLAKVLGEMGMKHAFAADADFSGMGPEKGTYIGAVAHKAFVNVNEAGTEAAAATAIPVFGAAAPTQVVFRADHPFVFLVRDNRSGMILFLGRLSAPSSLSDSTR